MGSAVHGGWNASGMPGAGDMLSNLMAGEVGEDERAKRERIVAMAQSQDLVRQRKRSVHKMHEFQNLCEEVMESALYNLVCESVFKEFDITRLPRTVPAALVSKAPEAMTTEEGFFD